MIRSQKELAEVKQPVESLSTSDRAFLRVNETRDWMQRNTRVLLIVLGVVVLAVVGLVMYSNGKAADNDRASTLLSHIAPYYEAGDYRKSIDGDPSRKIGNESVQGLRFIVNEFGSTPSGGVAALFLGNAYYYLGKLDSAEAAFNKASSDLPVHQASIEAGRAAILEQKGNKEEAAKLFQSAAKRDEHNPLNGEYVLSAARDLEQIGKKDEAVKLYRKLIEDFPSTEYDDAAKRSLMALNEPI